MSTLAATLARAWRAPIGLVVSSRVPRKTFAVPRRAAFRVLASATDADAPRPKSGKKPVPPPHFLKPPDPPPSVDAWQNMVLLMDKPKDWTSFDVVGKTRSMSRKFGSKKVGHCGTLDPMATGLLILCVGKATETRRVLHRHGQVLHRHDAPRRDHPLAGRRHGTRRDVPLGTHHRRGPRPRAPPR